MRGHHEELDVEPTIVIEQLAIAARGLLYDLSNDMSESAGAKILVAKLRGINEAFILLAKIASLAPGTGTEERSRSELFEAAIERTTIFGSKSEFDWALSRAHGRGAV